MGRVYAVSNALACLLLPIAMGCSDVRMSDAVQRHVDRVRDKVSETAEAVKETVKEKANLAGSMELTVERPLKTGRCYLSLLRLSAGRPTILQITSFQDPADESFPSAMLRGEVSAPSPAALVGQKLSLAMYVQSAADGPVWHTLRDQTVQLTISAADTSTFNAEITSGKLVNSDTGQTTDVQGKLTGSIDSN